MARTGKTSAPRRPASNRSTSGVGFSYEDLVAAWFLSGALVGERPLSLDGTLASIHFQTRASGWFIDDLLITTAAGEHAALSCKSGVVVGRAALPAEFASDVRAQWTTPGRFDPARDLLVHVSQRAHPDFVAAWSDIKRWRSPTDPDFTLTRIQSEPGPRRILSRLAGEAETAAQTDLDGLARLDRIEVVQLDLLQSNSLARSSALLKCQALQNAAMMFGLFLAAVTFQVVIDKAGERLIRLGRKPVRQNQASRSAAEPSTFPPAPAPQSVGPVYRYVRIVRPMLTAPANEMICGGCARVVNECECVASPR